MIRITTVTTRMFISCDEVDYVENYVNLYSAAVMGIP